MQKLLIIGAKGMLGQELVKAFGKDKSYEVTAWDKAEIDPVRNLSASQKQISNGVDITNERDVISKISKLKPSVILNAAAYNAVDKAEEPEEYKIAKKINGAGPDYLAKAAKKVGATLVHYSTDYVFDGQPDIIEPEGCAHMCSACNLHDAWTPAVGFDEQAKPHPISNYGKSKLLGEKAVAKNMKKYYIVRLSKLFGKSAEAPDAKKSFFEVMLAVGKKQKSVKVIDEETSCFTYAPDLAQKTKEILEAEKPYGIYHVVNSEPCTWYEAVLELYQQAKLKTRVISVAASEFPRPAKRPYYSVLLNTKLNPLRSYKEALKEYLKLLNRK